MQNDGDIIEMGVKNRVCSMRDKLREWLTEHMVGKTWNSEVQKMLDETISGIRKDVENEDPNTIGEHLMQYAAKNGINEVWDFLETFVDLLGKSGVEK